MRSAVQLFVVAVAVLLSACGGGGGGDRAPGVAPGPPPPGGNPPPEPVPPPQPPASVKAADIQPGDVITTTMVGVTMASPPVVTFSLLVNGSLRVTDLTMGNLNLTLAELVPAAAFGIDDWQSFIETVEDPVCRTQAQVDSALNACTTFTAALDPAQIPQSALKVQDPLATGKVKTLQANREFNGGALVDNADGTWTYTFAVNPGDPATLPNMLRACIQFELNAPAPNPCIDFVPADLADLGEAATSLAPGFHAAYRSRQVVTDASCNSCHALVAEHGGGRKAMDYCVTCHNPGSIDANSENTVDMSVMTHRIHNARNLPSVEAGGSYVIWGFENRRHDYSHVSYPQDMRNCTRCHAGQADVDYALAEGLPPPEATLTADGANWADKPSPAPCLACHEGAEDHVDSYGSCDGCHGPAATLAPVRAAHRLLLEEQARELTFEIENVSNTGPGESPVIDFNLKRNGVPVDIKDPGEFQGKLSIGVAWDAATDFDNDGISGFSALNIEVDAIADSTAIGGDSFRVNTAPETVVAGQDTVAVMLFGHENAAADVVAINSVITYAASDASTATPRREVVDVDRCDSCHRRLLMDDFGHVNFHAAPAEQMEVCAGCHGPGLAFDVSTDFRVLVHALHASDFRNTPYKDFDHERLQYPGDLADCRACHKDDTYQLPTPVDSQPLKDGLEGNPATLFTTPTAAVCASCHDDALASAHMEQAGGARFNVPEVEAAAAVEGCEVCHRAGASGDVDVVHQR